MTYFLRCCIFVLTTQGDFVARYKCHVCEQCFTRGNSLTAHLRKKHQFKWPSGHPRFRYKEHEDGFMRLQLIRYESVELTEQLMRGRPEGEDAARTDILGPGEDARAVAHSMEVQVELRGVLLEEEGGPVEEGQGGVGEQGAGVFYDLTGGDSSHAGEDAVTLQLQDTAQQLGMQRLLLRDRKQATMRLYSLLLLLLGSSHGLFTQLPELMEDEEGSGVTEATPEPEPVDDTYWSGTAPICMGGCKGRHQELKKDRCGDSDCCWFGYKSLCRVNCGRPDVDYNGMVYGNDWWVGSVVRYACRPGFLLVGDPARACQSNGGWTPKPSCLRVCRQGRVEITEKELETATCSSTCPLKSYMGPLKQGCYRIDNCRKINPDWKRWFTRCDTCLCDCHIACDAHRNLNRNAEILIGLLLLHLLSEGGSKGNLERHLCGTNKQSVATDCCGPNLNLIEHRGKDTLRFLNAHPDYVKDSS
ncbi:unnamed protein product [Coregonus sp. 'balchen']|nr:unnamed protein product [Coregonus sp. 'balchen']